ncbi:MAG: Hsp20/alpha crystallin family protein [Candidatus Micrarchaeia archaeon]
MAKKKIKSDPDIDDMYKLNRYLNKLINDFVVKNMDIKNIFENTPFKNGISLKFDQNGMPIIEALDNTIVQDQVKKVSDEPISEVIEKGDSVIIDAELPGANGESIKVQATEKSVHISASSASRFYDKRIDLPTSIDANSGKAVFNNGILELTFLKLSNDTPKVNVEVK